MAKDDYWDEHDIIKELYISVNRKLWDIIVEFNNGDSLNYIVKKDKKNEHISLPKLLREKVTEYERRKKINKLLGKLQ